MCPTSMHAWCMGKFLEIISHTICINIAFHNFYMWYTLSTLATRNCAPEVFQIESIE